MIGSRFGQYTIVDVLGEGGMGVVYRARDEKLHRFVALKFMPRFRSGRAGERDRFMEEARSASALNHPNVCTVHDVGEHGDELFIVMELIQGETLRSRIAQGEVRFDRWVRVRSRGRATLVRLPGLAETPIPGSLGPLSTDQASVSWDGREIIYNERLERANLVLIEHFE